MKGSLTVELSFVFPVILWILILFMQFGLYFMYRVYTVNAVNQSLAICTRARQEKKTVEETERLVETHLSNRIEEIPVKVEEMDCKADSGWFQEEYTLRLRATYSFGMKLSWVVIEKCCVMNPVDFRNRVDFLWEKGKQYLDQLDSGA